MKIILFRHGEKQRPDFFVADDKKDVYLTDFGISQINKLGETLKQIFPKLISSKIIYSSHYARAIQSGEIIKSILNIKKLEIIPEFGEFMAYTNYLNPREIRKHIQEMAMQNPDWVSPETNISLKQTLSNFQLKIIDLYQKTNPDFMLIASHGGIIRNFVYSLEPKFRPSDNEIADAKIQEGGYTVIDFDGQNFSVAEFDIHDFL